MIFSRQAMVGLTVAGSIAAGVSRRRLRAQLVDTHEQLVRAKVDLAAVRARLVAAETAALTDSLTGVANRTHLEAALAHRSAACTQRFAVLVLDLDGFKLVNDTFGHKVGDTVLVEAAARLAGVAGDGDLVGRFGGDEFVIITSATLASLVAMRVCATMRPPITVAGIRQVRVTASVGVAYGQRGDDVQALVHSADRAMYEAKAAGRDRWAEYHGDLARVPDERPRVRLRELRDAAADATYVLAGVAR